MFNEDVLGEWGNQSKPVQGDYERFRVLIFSIEKHLLMQFPVNIFACFSLRYQIKLPDIKESTFYILIFIFPTNYFSLFLERCLTQHDVFQ